MARSYRPVIRDQEFLLPPNMADWLPEGHLVWFVIDVVEQLDTAVFHAGRRRGGVGREGYDPDMLLGLLLYAYAVGERSSRRIERLCIDHVAFRVLCGQDGPDHTTISRFRADHQDAFVDLFAQVLRLCAAQGMVKVGVVSIDGTKIAADAARGANRTPDAVRKEARRIVEQAREQARRVAGDIVTDAQAADAAEDAAAASAAAGRDDHDLPPGFATRSGRAANLAKAIEELERQDSVHEAVDQVDRDEIAQTLTRLEQGEGIQGRVHAGADPVAWYRAKVTGAERLLAQLAGVTGPGVKNRRDTLRQRLHRAQRSLALAEQQAAARAAGPAGPDGPDLRGRAERRRQRREDRLRARGGAGRTVNVTDPDSRLMTEGSGGGSVQGYNAQVAVSDDHLIIGIHLSQDSNDLNCYLPTLHAASTTTTDLGIEIGTVLADSGYFTDENLTTPGPERLIAPGRNKDLHDAARDKPASGRPPPDASAKDAMRHQLRIPEHAQTYKRRSATVETVIAHVKDQVGLRRFTRRGLPAATAELHLAATVVNLRRVHARQTATA